MRLEEIITKRHWPFRAMADVKASYGTCFVFVCFKQPFIAADDQTVAVRIVYTPPAFPPFELIMVRDKQGDCHYYAKDNGEDYTEPNDWERFIERKSSSFCGNHACEIQAGLKTAILHPEKLGKMDFIWKRA